MVTYEIPEGWYFCGGKSMEIIAAKAETRRRKNNTEASTKEIWTFLSMWTYVDSPGCRRRCWRWRDAVLSIRFTENWRERKPLFLSVTRYHSFSFFLFFFFLRISALSRTPLFFPSVSRARGSVNTHTLSLYPSILARLLSPSLSFTLSALSYFSLALSLSLSLDPLSRSPYRSFFVTDVRKTT